MAILPALLPIEKYLSTSYRPDVDYVDGELEERSLGEYEHSRLQALLAALFVGKESAWQVRAVVEQRIRVSSTRVRICDLAVLRASAPREKVTETPPLLCIEILSPEDRLSRAQAVLADYFAMGVTILWLIDPIRRSAHIFNESGLQLADATRLAVPGTPIHVDLTEAFAALD